MKRKTTLLLAILPLSVASSERASAADGKWPVVLRADDIVVGEPLQKLNTRRHWSWNFNDGVFEVAVRKSAVPIPSPQCRMNYLILTMPLYYPENPAQAPTADRRAVYDALIAIKKTGKGGLTVHFDALWYWRLGLSGPELTTCNIYFTLPLLKDAANISP
jgi:hypothetical protein